MKLKNISIVSTIFLSMVLIGVYITSTQNEQSQNEEIPQPVGERRLRKIESFEMPGIRKPQEESWPEWGCRTGLVSLGILSALLILPFILLYYFGKKIRFRWLTEEEKWELFVFIACLYLPIVGWIYLIAREDIKRALQRDKQ